MSFLCVVFVDLGTHHIESESLETLYKSSYQSIVIRKLGLGNFWFSGERILEFTYGSNFGHSFISLNLWKFANSHEITWNFSQLTEWVLVDQKNIVWINHGTPHCFYRVSMISAIYPSWASPVVSLLIWEPIVLCENHLNLCTHDRISLSWCENYVWATCDSVKRGSWASLMVLSLTTFFYFCRFIKVCNISRNCLKLFTNDRISLGWGKNILWISHGKPYCFWRVSKISAIYTHDELPLWCLCWFGNSSYWIRITWNFGHIIVSVYLDEKTMFGQVVTQWRKVAGVHLWF